MTGGRRRRVVFFGVRHWCTYLIDAIAAACDDPPDMEVFDWRHPTVAWSRRSVAMRVGFRPGARTWRGTLFDLLWMLTTRPTARRTYWIGTDVLRAVEHPTASRRGAVTRWLAGRSGCGSPWFVDELRSIGLDATYLRFPYRSADTTEVPDWPAVFTVSAYIPHVNASNYGSAVLRTLTERLPDVRFVFFGGANVSDRPNVEHLGWGTDVTSVLDDSVVHVRLTAHDGIAGTVRDALARSRYVIFTYPLPGVDHVAADDADAVCELLTSLQRSFAKRALAANETGRAYVAEMDHVADALRLRDWLVAEL